MTKIPKLKLILLLITYFLLLSASAHAAELNLISQTQEIDVGQQFQVDVILNTEEEELNAVEGSVIFPNSLAALKEIRDGNSIISFWIERSKMTNEDKIEFSGIIPGGYKETNGFLFSVIFTAKTEGKGIIEFRNIRVLKNDGLGTPANVKISNFQFSITHEIPKIGTPIDTKKDTEPPEDFKPEIASGPTIFEGKWFLVFATQDKGSGIDHYEILEKREYRILNLEFGELIRKILYPKSYILNSWTIAESPYVLKDQKLRSYIYVKAVDKNGNERVIVLPPRYPIKWYENYWIWIIIILIIIFSFIVIKGNLWKKL